MTSVELNPLLDLFFLNQESLSSLASKQDLLGYTKEPVFYHTTKSFIPKYKVQIKDSKLTVMSSSFHKSYNLDDKKIGTVRHDLVASCWQSETDMKLSVLGVKGEEGNLTPDFIDASRKIAIELATTLSDNTKSLLNDFSSKMLKYDYLLMDEGVSLYAIVVSPSVICTNLTMTQDDVDQFCMRVRLGRSIENIIREKLSVDIFANSISAEDSRTVKLVFNSIKENNSLSSKEYDFEVIKSLSEPPTDEERHEVASILSKAFKTTRSKSQIGRLILDEYLSNFNITNSRSDKKRVCNFPLVVPSNNESKFIIDGDLPSDLYELWRDSEAVIFEKPSIAEQIENAMGENDIPAGKHLWKKNTMFKYSLHDEEKLSLALRGVRAKSFEKKKTKEIIEKSAKSKLSFHPNTDISDITDFLESEICKHYENNIITDEMKEIIKKGKTYSTNHTKQNSLDVFDNIINTKLVTFASLLTEVFTDLSFCYKHWVGKNQMLRRETKSGVKMLICPTGSHIFVSYAIPKNSALILETGKIGPSLYETSSHYISDFCSYNEPTLEHFIKAGPYIASLLIHIKSMYEVDPLDNKDVRVQRTMSLITLLYLNNKLDSEELMTSQRYMFMRMLEDVPSDPYEFVDRLPTVLRSRLTVYLLRQTVSLMEYYSLNRILKKTNTSESGIIYYDYLNIKSICHDDFITLKQKVNEFYFGYVISKEKGRGSDRTFKILEKILKEEYAFRDLVTETFNTSQSPVKYCVNKYMMKSLINSTRESLRLLLGESWTEIMDSDIVTSCVRSSFSDVATLKASSKQHDSDFDLPEDLLDIIDNDDEMEKKDAKLINKKLKDMNPDEFQRRPKVLEALINMANNYESETGKKLTHIVQLLPWCLSRLMTKGYFDSDCFPKSQHGGDREIHVLELSARIVQYFIEKISKVICGYFSSESLTHPSTKESFVKQHYTKSNMTFKEYLCLSKSADASKWAQRHHVSHFAALLNGIVPQRYKPFLITAFSLWTTKKISFPPQFVTVLLKNRRTKSNETFERFRNEFYMGNGLFSKSMSNKITIKSGMMQGILHYTSSLYHTGLQEMMKQVVESYSFSILKRKVVSTIIQGSDDSAMMLSVEPKSPAKDISMLTRLLMWKEEIAPYYSIYPSTAKSSIGTVDLVEYNSEWHSRHQIIKPTFRWISACMETSIIERFIDRVRIFNNVLTQCLEGGATTLESSVIQLCQSWLHYSLIGFHTSDLAKSSIEMLLEMQDPSLGFFPCDYDICAGIPGVDFQLYCLYMNGKLPAPNYTEESIIGYNYEGQHKSEQTSHLRSVKLKFGKLSIWQNLVDNVSIGTYENAIQQIEDNPLLIFGRHTSWEEEKPSLLLKIFSPGVRESIANRSPTLRMMSAASYMLSTNCITYYDNDGRSEKVSLYKLIKKRYEEHRNHDSRDPSLYFPLAHSYRDFREMVEEITTSSMLYDEEFRRSSKQRVLVFDRSTSEHSLVECCKRKWLSVGRVVLSSSQFDRKWSELKLKYWFLKDTLEETKNTLKLTTVELKSFLESMEFKTRSVVLQDSPATGGGLEGNISRLYWPNTKIRTKDEKSYKELSKLRSLLYSVCTFWLSLSSTVKLVSEIILSSSYLDADYDLLPQKAKSLKIFKMFLESNGNEKTKMEITEKLVDLKKGSIGYFVEAQTGYGLNRKGNGRWVGKVAGVPTEIKLYNNSTVYIRIKNMSEAKILGKMLSSMIKDFNSFESSGQKHFEPSFFLTRSGQFIMNNYENSEVIPVILDHSFNVDIVKDIFNIGWFIKVVGSSIKLCFKDETTNSQITILSEVLKSDDWVQGMSDTRFLRYPGLSEWSKGETIGVDVIDNEISKMVPGNRSKFNSMLRKMNTINSDSEWNLKRFQERLLSVLVSKTDMLSTLQKGNENSNMEEVSSPKTGEVSDVMALFDSFVMDGQTHDLDDALQDIEWADDIEEDNEYDQNAMMLSYVEEGVDLFANAFYDPDVVEEVTTSWNSMPLSNRFFSSFDMMCQIVYNQPFAKLLSEARLFDNVSYKGLIGRIISVCISKYKMSIDDESNEDDDELVQSTLNYTRLITSIISNEDYQNVDIQKLSEDLELAKSRLVVYKEMKDSYAIRIAQSDIQRMENIMRRVNTGGMHDELNLHKYELILGAMMTRNLNGRRETYDNIPDDAKLPLYRLDIEEFVSEELKFKNISLEMANDYRESLRNRVVSTGLMELLSNYHACSIDIPGYRRRFEDSEEIMKMSSDGLYYFEEESPSSE